MASITLEAGGTSTRPYLIRALHEWCTDNGFTPYLAVHVDNLVQVPSEYVKNQEIVLNVGFEATSGLKLGNEFIEFKARFGGVAREIIVPVDHVVAIYARENGQGMAFPAPASEAVPSASPAGKGPLGAAGTPHLAVVDDGGDTAVDASDDTRDDEPPPPNGPRPMLKRIK
jgi:stringent starvation protein B